MRGKYILWLSLIATLLTPMMIFQVKAPVGNAKIFIDPDRIPGAPDVFGHPGNVFEMAVKVSDFENLWSIGFRVQYGPYGRPLVVSEVKEGDFLKQGGYKTSFTYKINILKGQLSIGVTRLLTYPLPVQGAYGDGTLATFKFKVVEAGDCDISIIDTLAQDPSLAPLSYNAFNGYYHGVTANLIRLELAAGRRTPVGSTQLFSTKVINKGDVPLTVRVRLDLERLEDGRRLKMYSGQRYLKGWFGEPPIAYLKCNGFTGHYSGDPDYGWGFYEVGDSPYLDEIDSTVDYYDPAGGTGNYMWTNVVDSIAGRFDFETYDLSDPDDVLQVVALEVYMASPPHNADDPDTHWDLDVVARAPGQPPPSVWIGSWCGIPEFRWVINPQHVGTDRFSDYFPTLLTQAGLDEARIRYFSYYSEGGGDVGPVIIDAMRLRLEFSAFDPSDPDSYEIGPYPTELELPDGSIKAKDYMVGTYVVTATLEYTLAGIGWMEGAKTRTISWEIIP